MKNARMHIVAGFLTIGAIAAGLLPPKDFAAAAEGEPFPITVSVTPNPVLLLTNDTDTVKGTNRGARKVTIHGQTRASGTRPVTISIKHDNDPPVGALVQPDASGRYSFSEFAPLQDGTYEITVSAPDARGEAGTTLDVIEVPDLSAAQSRLQKLEQRISSLEQALSKSSRDAKGSDTAPDDDETLTVRAPFVVLDAAGHTIFRVDVARENLPRIAVGNLLGAHIEMGPGARGNSALAMYDDTNAARIELVAGAKQETYLRLRNAAGKSVAGLIESAEGGRVIVAAADTGKTVASLVSGAAGGAVRVFPAGGGKTRGELVVDGIGGGLHLWDAAGQEVLVNLTSNGLNGTGRIEIGNGRGDIVVTAGATDTNAVGFVSTGPYDAGVAGTMGGGLKAASTLLGSKTEGKSGSR